MKKHLSLALALSLLSAQPVHAKGITEKLVRGTIGHFAKKMAIYFSYAEIGTGLTLEALSAILLAETVRTGLDMNKHTKQWKDQKVREVSNTDWFQGITEFKFFAPDQFEESGSDGLFRRKKKNSRFDGIALQDAYQKYAEHRNIYAGYKMSIAGKQIALSNPLTLFVLWYVSSDVGAYLVSDGVKRIVNYNK